jgi:hypothetical protein
MKDIDTYNLGIAKGEKDYLLGFQGAESDDEKGFGKKRTYGDHDGGERPFRPFRERGDESGGNFFDRRGGRGNRGGFRGGEDSRGGRGAGRGERGGAANRPKNLLSAENFPTLA